jgi:molecular chaperone GrpE (heat shock protein)
MTPEEKEAKRAPILNQIKKKEAKIAKLKDEIKEAEAREEPKDDSQNAVGSPPAHNNLEELRLNLVDAEIALVDLHTKLNTYAGRRRTRRGGAQNPVPPRPTLEILDEYERNLRANPNDADKVLKYLIAVLSYHRDIFDAVETRRLTNVVKLRASGQPFAPRVMEILRGLKFVVGPPPPRPLQLRLPLLARLRVPPPPPADIGGRHRTSRRTRKSRKTRRS